MNRKILFVDDEPAALKLYKQMLNGEFDIATALSGEDAIAMLTDRGPFAIVISDLKLPGMDGAQFLKRMQQVAPNTVRLLLTEESDDGSLLLWPASFFDREFYHQDLLEQVPSVVEDFRRVRRRLEVESALANQA